MKVQVHSGKLINLFKMKKSDILIEDIAHSLSFTPRFNGHTKVFLSVAWHSIQVAAAVSPEYQLEALLHDASEAYIGDLITPIKHHPSMAPFRELERTIETAIFKRFGVKSTDRSLAAVKRADVQRYKIERDLYLNTSNVAALPKVVVEQEFLARFKEYGGKA
jgi:5'-deoxynucleotidase YfbR-like HD superfamily hydrolase